jgi:predicted HicB family RNase H-like nuclease
MVSAMFVMTMINGTPSIHNYFVMTNTAKSKKTEKIELRVQPELKDGIKEAAEAEKMTVSAWIQSILKNEVRKYRISRARKDQ